MKRMKLLPVIMLSIMLFGAVGNHLYQAKDHKDKLSSDTSLVSEDKTVMESESEDEESETAFSWEEPPLPDFLAKYHDSASWGADTICVANGKAYYIAYDEYGRTDVIYTLDELICEDPTLMCESIGSNFKTKFRISTSYNSMVVDFADRKNVEKLKSLTAKCTQMKRFSKDYFSKSDNTVLYHIDIDYPPKGIKNADGVRKWLVNIVNESMTNDKDLPEPTSIYIGYSKRNHNNWKYKGDIRDVKALGKFASERYFALTKIEYAEDFPSTLFSDLSLRLISSNGKYVSYQKYTHEYYGGAHGYYTEDIISYALSTNEEINWKYLFVPGCENKVLDLFYKSVKNNPHYQNFENTQSIKEIKEYFETMSDALYEGHIILPKPGLTDKGVMFSYQPYDISCFAAGCFHFTIPYSELKPYLTSKAKRLLNMQ